MKLSKCNFLGIVCVCCVVLAGSAVAQESGSAGASVTVNSTCNSNRFNLEPRLNAAPQHSESVDFLPNRVSPGVDLVVGAGDDARPSTIGGFDAYYVFRQGAKCEPNFEGTVSPAGGDLPIDPTVVADPARDAFFFSDTLFGSMFAEVARSTAATLMSTSACPNGTQLQGSNPNCWPVVGLANFTNSAVQQSTLLDSHIAVDPRKTGTGAGDVYVVAEFLNTTNFPSVSNIQIIACTNVTVSCGTPVVISGTDPAAERPYVQVRTDGTVTISYWTFTKPNTGAQPNPIDIKFVTCTPQGAPKAPVCTKATLVATSRIPGLFAPGGSGLENFLFPKHANRLESDGKTFTTFLVYDRCQAIVGRVSTATPVCSKIDVVVLFSMNGGATWSAPVAVESMGHQFMGTIRNDVSMQTINIAYYSTQEDVFRQRAKIRLRQIAAGSTTLGAASIITTATDPDAGIQDINLTPSEAALDFGDRIGLAAAGTGVSGQSKVYVHYTSTNVFGTFNGVSQPDQNNTLSGASY